MIGKSISHYHILEKLGAGGRDVVYKAKNSKLKRSSPEIYFSLVEQQNRSLENKNRILLSFSKLY